MTIWPGMDYKPFTKRTKVEEDASTFSLALACFIAGILMILFTCVFISTINYSQFSWLLIFSLLLIVHFGYAQFLTLALRLVGWDVKPLFNNPLKASSLNDFWSRRWNLAFVDMDKILIMNPIKKHLNPTLSLLCVFLISGFLHELAISFPASSGWGLPLIYFCIQGVLIIIERKTKITASKPNLQSRLWTWSCILIPLPLLFHEAFRTMIVDHLAFPIKELLALKTLPWYLKQGLILAACGHFFTFIAGGQLPMRLNWKTDLKKLSNFNRKIFINYYAVVGFIIFAFAIITLINLDEILTGSKLSISFCILVALFWLARILVDTFFFKHEDWPLGVYFVLGHSLLTSLFIFLFINYFALAYFHILNMIN